MAKTIGNPFSWAAQHLGASGTHLAESSAVLGGTTHSQPQIRDLHLSDLRGALRAGIDDFMASRTDAMLAVVIYPLAGLLLIIVGFQLNAVHLLFPLLAGFALLGPVAAVGLYQISRQREAGQDANWADAFGVVKAPGFGAILVLGIGLGALFLIWIVTAHLIHMWTIGPDPAASFSQFLRDVFQTSAGWTMIVVGVGVGFVFALVALAVSVVSFPLLLDRQVGVPTAVVTSVRVMRRNPGVILCWGLIVATLLVLGAIPILAGLILIIPILGHATWHLYRRAVV
ncbi:DUF2189 domain-containing protein [Pontibaca salina]|uniref:DUF2189 domain-containing protein n=1 Tax=Pontibaca salina TaxID=2795731 RepID=A0A934HRX0_9RHOB|nr:DUF2189 domain-containing protein [Pontibaca salina]MBI6629751.1 DUF2189 domain-containing protein [Pontibaca salina]